MQSRRDQVHAHMFVMSRLSLGMLRDDPDAPESPHRRTTKGYVIGLVIAVLAALAVTVYGLVVPGGSNAWKATGTLVLDERSGARYLTVDGVLHPVLNETSAKLLAGERMKVVSVEPPSRTPRAARPLGIVGAPDPLPRSGALSRDAWSVCATRPDAAEDPLLTLGVGLTAEGPVTSGRTTLVRTVPGDDTYLLWHGTRMRLDPANYAVQSLGYDADAAYPVPEAFLNALPSGPDLAVPEVAGRGKAGPSLALAHPGRAALRRARRPLPAHGEGSEEDHRAGGGPAQGGSAHPAHRLRGRGGHAGGHRPGRPGAPSEPGAGAARRAGRREGADRAARGRTGPCGRGGSAPSSARRTEGRRSPSYCPGRTR